MRTIDNDIRKQLSQLQELFAKSKNTFLSDDDVKVTKKYLTQCDKHIEEVYVKAQNAQKLL